MSRTFLLSLLCFVLCLSCRDGSDDVLPVVPSDTARRTVLMYVVAQNSLGYPKGTAGFHENDSIEIMKGRDALRDDDRLLVFTDDGRQPPRLLRYTRECPEPEVVRRWEGPVDASDPQTFADVLKWTATYFPAREYALVCWSHGDGWLPSTNTDYARSPRRSFGIDCGEGGAPWDNRTKEGRTGTQMNIEDMAAAIASCGVHMRYIFFDACLMQNVEVAYALRDVTDYVVGSPALIPAYGACYTNQLRHGLFSNDPADIARTYFDDVRADSLESYYEGFGVAISAVRTDRLQRLADILRRALPASTAAGNVSPPMGGVFAYLSYDWHYSYRPHYYDARQVLRALLPASDAAEAEQALMDAVVYYAGTQKVYVGPGYYSFADYDSENCCSVAMFVPQNVYTQRSLIDETPDHNQSFTVTEWYGAAGWNQTGW